jgi:hypothetical protein
MQRAVRRMLQSSTGQLRTGRGCSSGTTLWKAGSRRCSAFHSCQSLSAENLYQPASLALRTENRQIRRLVTVEPAGASLGRTVTGRFRPVLALERVAAEAVGRLETRSFTYRRAGCTSGLLQLLLDGKKALDDT